MDIIDNLINYLQENSLLELGLVIALIAGASVIYITIRNHQSIVNYNIEYKKAEFLKTLDELIQEFKRYVYSFDAETYSKRKQPNENFLTYKSDQLNARLEKLINMQSALKNKQFKDIDSVEKALSEINNYVKSTHGMMVKLKRKVRGNKMDNGHHSF